MHEHSQKITFFSAFIVITLLIRSWEALTWENTSKYSFSSNIVICLL